VLVLVLVSPPVPPWDALPPCWIVLFGCFMVVDDDEHCLAYLAGDLPDFLGGAVGEVAGVGVSGHDVCWFDRVIGFE